MVVKQQSEKDIKNLSGLQALRSKISMYLGGSDGSAMWTAIREALDNFVDEASAGRNTYGHLIADPKKPLAFWIVDHGGGMPVGDIDIENPVTQKIEKVSALKALVALVHTGGKFDLDDSNEGMRGTHGVGIKATNASSNVFTVWTFRAKQWWTIGYEKGREVTKVSKITKGPTVPSLGLPKKGTVVYVELDPTVFDKGSVFDEEEISAWFDMTAAFSHDLELNYTDAEGTTTNWECTGPEAYADSLLEDFGAALIADNATVIARGKFWDLALNFTDYDGIGVNGFTNGLHNRDGGTHVNSVYDAVSAVVSAYAKRGHKFNPSDLRDGLVGAINVKMTGVKFHNQEKSKLVDERAKAPLYDELVPHLEEFFATKAGRVLAETLCERASMMSELKNEFKQNKRVMKVLRDAKRRNALPNKLVASLSCTNEERELFLVEGDSAGGSAKMARDSSYQEVLPLKGKIPNAFGTKASTAIESEEILNMLTAIGYDPSLDEPFANLRVGKVIILTDADVDGLHIQNLILASMIKFVPQLINEGRVYVAQRYEYLAEYKGEFWFAETLEKLGNIAPKAAMANAKHLKGLGEVNAPQLADMAFNPEKRKLFRLRPIDSKMTKRIAELAGTDSVHRKELLGV